MPQFYLREFANGVGRQARVFVTDLEASSNYHTLVRNVGGKRDFHRVEIDGVDPNAYEQAYSLFEDEAAPMLREVIAAKSFPSPDHFNMVMNFIALLSVRNPSIRRNMHDGLADLYDMIGKMALSSKERWEKIRADMIEDGHPISKAISYEEVKEFSDRGEYDVVVGQTYFVQQEVRMVDTVLPWLARRHWSFKLAADDAQFVTSDFPAVLTWDNDKPAPRPPGHGLRGTVVYCPISSDVALLGSFDPVPSTHELDAAQVASANSIAASYAQRQIFSRDDQAQFQAFGRIVPPSGLLDATRN